MKQMKQKQVEEKEMCEVDRMSMEILEKYLNRVVKEHSSKINNLKMYTSTLVIVKRIIKRRLPLIKVLLRC